LLYQSSPCITGLLSYADKWNLLKAYSGETFLTDSKDYIVIDVLKSISQSGAESKSFITDAVKQSRCDTESLQGRG